jgi:hypothetical protein
LEWKSSIFRGSFLGTCCRVPKKINNNQITFVCNQIIVQNIIKPVSLSHFFVQLFTLRLSANTKKYLQLRVSDMATQKIITTSSRNISRILKRSSCLSTSYYSSSRNMSAQKCLQLDNISESIKKMEYAVR